MKMKIIITGGLRCTLTGRCRQNTARKLYLDNLSNIIESTRQERWPSGLRRTLGKCVTLITYRGFESLSRLLRSNQKELAENIEVTGV